MLVRSTEPGWIDVRAGAVGPVGAGALGEGGSTVGEAGPPPLTATGFDAGCFEGGAVTGELPPMTATAAPIVGSRLASTPPRVWPPWLRRKPRAWNRLNKRARGDGNFGNGTPCVPRGGTLTVTPELYSRMLDGRCDGS